jgi:hypothetical protein
MAIEIFLDVSESILIKAKYTIENIFFPYNEEFLVIDKYYDCNGFNKRIIYCNENSQYLNNINKNNLYIVLENSTVEFYSHFIPYNTNEILFLEKIPCLFPLKKFSLLKRHSNVIPYDLFAASFFFLSCWQEYSISERDRKGRIPLKATLQNKLGIIRIPIVNEYLRIFEEYIKRLWDIKLEYKKLPGNTNRYVALSHDICRIDMPLKRYLKYLFSNRKVIEKSFSSFVGLGKNIWYKKKIFEKIKKLELEYGASSTYYFLSRYPREYINFSRHLIKSFNGTAFEVGHHLSDNSIFDGSLNDDNYFFKEVVREYYGERVHRLRFEVDKLFSQLEDYKYYYDNSLLFAEDVGYRTGFTYPHYIFDHVRKKPFNVLAIPLNVMDGTLVDRNYLCLNDDIAEKELFRFTKEFFRYGGVLSILFHNSFFWLNTDRRLKMFERLLRFLTEQGVGVGTCKDVFLWHKKMYNPLSRIIK